MTEPFLSIFCEQERLLKAVRSRVPVGLDIRTESGEVEKREFGRLSIFLSSSETFLITFTGTRLAIPAKVKHEPGY